MATCPQSYSCRLGVLCPEEKSEHVPDPAGRNPRPPGARSLFSAAGGDTYLDSRPARPPVSASASPAPAPLTGPPSGVVNCCPLSLPATVFCVPGVLSGKPSILAEALNASSNRGSHKMEKFIMNMVEFCFGFFPVRNVPCSARFKWHYLGRRKMFSF